MKILKKRLMVVVMSLALFLTGIFAVGGIDSKKADAFSPNYLVVIMSCMTVSSLLNQNLPKWFITVILKDLILERVL